MSSPEFIETKGSLERVNQVLNGIRSGNPLLLEGETGSSKTRTAIVASIRNNQKPIVINFSSQTTIEDLIGRITKDTDSWGGFSYTYGPYTEAFMNGYCLILDEINLAYENVLQCIEASLDSGKLFLEISGSETKVVHMHPNFHLIATQNPLTGRFSQKRQFLSSKFRSRFQVITFHDIKEDELLEIANGLARDLPDSEESMEKLVRFHFDWKKKEAKENQIHVFTIREISGTIKSMKEGLSLFESIMVHYGSRYDVQKLEQMKEMLISVGVTPTDSSISLPQFDPNLFYMTKSIQRSLLNSTHLLQTCHPILITGPDGCGKTSYARWIAQIYNSQINQNLEEEEEEEEINQDDQKETEKSNEQNETTEQAEQIETTEQTEQNENNETADQNQTEESKEQTETAETTEQNEQKEQTEQKETTEQNEPKEQTSQTKPAEQTEQKAKKRKLRKKKNKPTNTTNVFICNPEVSISDIIGRYTPVMGATGEAPIQWIDGPVVSSLRKGDCLIMDQIDTAPSTILERLNSLYDNFGIKDARFSVQENSEEESILIHPNFRIIATSSYEGLNDISPALLNRFTIIYVDDQLVELFNENKLFEFIKHLSPQSTQKSDIKLIEKYAKERRAEMVISRISKIIKGFFSIKNTFPSALSKSILEFCFSATSSSTDLPFMDESFVSLLLSSLNEDKGDSTFDTFLFKEASATRQIMAVLVAAFIAGFHVVLIGKTGLGKTSAAIALSRLCQFSQGRQFISFNGETQLEELFGYFTIEKGNFTPHSGPLSDAMEQGKIFVADELNLADQMIVQSLNVAIEPSKNDQIILPVIGRNIIVNERFFFIGCQNDISMYGRKPLPPQFQKKVLCIKYPENSRTDLLSLISSLARQFSLDMKCSNGTAEMIEKMKQDSVFQKKVWSLREVRRLFRRTEYISKHRSQMSGFEIQTNAAFLLRSAFRDTIGITEKAVVLVSKAFNLSDFQTKSLLKDLESEVKVTKIVAKSQIQLRKNRLSITIINSELLKIPEELQSFWQTLFEVGITHPSEPLLLVGPSGFKTFLAKSVCPRSPVVYLHSDTTISSLVGQITLLDKDQARNFLLDSLYNFAGPAPPEEFQALFQEIREMEIIDIEKMQDVKKFINNQSFNNIVENIIQQLFEIDHPQQNVTSAFSNYLSIFKPGLITKYILKQNSLILKNIAQPSPTVLERLNELLSVTPTLTLFEDTSNTITPADNKILSQFSANFRIIGICLPREKRGLSEAMLSRLTEISVPRYTNQDQEKVIDSILLQSEMNNDKSFNLYKKLLDTVSKIFINQNEELSMSIPFTKIIEIVRISIAWRTFFSKYEKFEKEESLFSLALFRCAAGPLPYENKKVFLKVFFNEKSGLTISDDLKKLFDDKIDEETSPSDFLFLEEKEQTIIQSSISKMFMPSPLSRLPDYDFCFTSSTKDLIDVIMSASVINYPLIIEGPNGSGKSSAILYLSKCVDANVVRISISSSTTVEDLFGKYEPNTSSESLKFDFQPTNFLNAIRHDRDSSNDINLDDFSPLKKQWIIIEELHLASASVLDSLAPVFNKQTEQVFLPDGQIVAKRDYFIVGLISQPLQNQSISNTSMIYKVRDYTKPEYDQIYKYILSNNNFSDDVCSYFSDQMFTLSKLSASSQSKIPITVREVHKFLNLFEGSEGQMDINLIIKNLCLGRFTNNEFIENAKAELEYDDENYVLPSISVEMGTSTLKSGGIPMHINAGSSKGQYEIQYLSSSEKELFVFLSMSMKKYTPIVIQGPTASGKTYTVQLFSDIVGKNLRIIQLNSEITSQTIAGTFQPSKNLSAVEMNELQEALQSISSLPNLPQEYAEKIQNEDINSWLPRHFKQLRNILQNIKDELNAIDKEKALNFIKKVDNLLQFYNHLKRSDSVIIKAMLEGSWLLLDGIEAAPSDFLDRLSTLIDNNPLLNLYERGNGFIYSRDSPNPDRRIHPDFRLIMTYNPVDVSSSNSLSPSLLSRCTIYSMKAIDSNLNDSSLVIFGFLNQLEFQDMDEDPSELSIKLGKSHMSAKEFTSNSQFSVTGRTLIHLCHNIIYKTSIGSVDFTELKNIVRFIYGSLMDDPNKFLEAVEEKFEQTIDINILEFIKKAALSTSKGCIEIISLIDNFMNETKENIQAKFDFEAFLGWLLQLHLKDIETVYDKVRYILIVYLQKLVTDIKSSNTEMNMQIKKLFAHWSSIRILEILVTEIRQACHDFEKELSKNATLSSPQVQEISNFKIILKKIRCILHLINNGLFIMQSLPILFYENASKEFLSLFELIDEKKPIDDICQAIATLKNDDDSKLIINFQENPIYFLDSMVHFHESDNWMPKINTVSKMIASCIFFNIKNCNYLFKGISKLFYNTLESLLNDESDISIFIDLFDYVSLFYKILEINTSITLDEFISLFSERSNDPKIFNKCFQSLRTINNRSAIQSEHAPLNEIKEIKPITDAVNYLYQDYNEKYGRLYLQGQKDQEAAKEFLGIIESINNRLETEKVLKVPLELYVRLTDDIEINTKSFAFLKEIFLSIKEPKEPKIDTFEWPHEHISQFSNETPSFPLFDALINYSKSDQIDFKSANWMKLCSFEKNAEFFLKQFLKGEISEGSIELYKTIIKSKLLYELSKIKEDENTKKYQYCSREAIIKFFNGTGNRSAKISQTFIDLAHHYEMKMSRNFVINIPKFDSKDVTALLVNPIDFSPGPIFTDFVINADDREFLQSYYNAIQFGPLFEVTKLYLTENGIQPPDVKSLEDLCNNITTKGSIENHIQNMVQAFYTVSNIEHVALTKSNSKLSFNDIPRNFNENFICKQPFCGFYLSLHPEVLTEINRILKLVGDSSFPLSLLAYRSYSNQDIVQIKLPSTLSPDTNEFISYISDVIITNCNNGKITKFSNLIGFLLDQVPVGFDTQQSEHFREIMLDLLTKPKEPILLKYMVKYLRNNFEKMILILGSEQWNNLIVANLAKNKDNEIIKFMMNPWEIALQSIKNDFNSVKRDYNEKIRKACEYFSNQISYRYSNRGFFNLILDAKRSDEKELQTKIREEYKRLNEQINLNPNEESKSLNLNKAWRNYCSYVLNALNQIKDFPNVYEGKLPFNDFYNQFYAHFKKNSAVSYPTADLEATLIIFTPKKESTQEVTISYTKGKQTVNVSGKLNKISVMKLPANSLISDFNIQSNDVNIDYYTIFYDSTVQPRKSFKMSEMLNSFNEYVKLSNQDDDANDDDDDESINKQLGKVEVLFNNKSYDDFKGKVESLSKDVKDSLSTAGISLKKLSESSKMILEKIKELSDYFPANFTDKSETPKETNEKLDQFVNFINQCQHDLSEINVPDDVIDADEQFIVNKKSEFLLILSNVTKFSRKPTPTISEDTTQYTPNELISKNPDNLIVPTIFMDGNKFCLNITSISANLGPYYKGCQYSSLKIKIINLTNQKIKCTFQQDNKIVDLYYQDNDKDGFFYLVFPIDKLVFDYNEDSVIKFSGKVSFYEVNSETAFKEVSYDITMLFLSPNIYLQAKNNSFAIKDGEAQISPYYALRSSDLVFKIAPLLNRQLKYIELPDNTCEKPPTQKNTNKKNEIKFILPSRTKDANHLAVQFDFGLSANMPIPVSLNVDLFDEAMSAFIYCDYQCDFVSNRATVTIGNIWRDIYFLISYYNPKNDYVTAKITFPTLIAKDFEISAPNEIQLKPFSTNVEIFSFKARTRGRDYERGSVPFYMQVTIGTLTKKIDFYLYTKRIFYDAKREVISLDKYLKVCSFWNGDSFEDYKYGSKYDLRDINLFVSPESIYLKQDRTNDEISLKYGENGELMRIYDQPKKQDSQSQYQNTNRVEYEILCIDMEEGSPIKTIIRHNCRQKEGTLSLFARVRGRPDTVFPLFGEDKKVNSTFDASTYNFKENNYAYDFIVWFEQFLEEHDKTNELISIESNKFVFNNYYPSSHNFAYLITFMCQHYQKLPYVGLLKAIKEFTNSDLINEIYTTTYREFNNLEWKLVSIVWAIYQTMLTQYNNLMVFNFIINFPISSETLLNEQKRLCGKFGVDEASMRRKKEFINSTKNMKDRIEGFNENEKNKLIKEGYVISPFAKWTFENKFQEITENEFPKTESVKSIDEKIHTEYSKEAGSIDITNASFDNMTSIKAIYGAFDFILKNAYQFTISLHSCGKDMKKLTQNTKVFNQLVSFYMWANDIKNHSPYSSFFDKFFSAYQSMMTRLQLSGLTIRHEHLIGKNILLLKDDFVEKPKYTAVLDFKTQKWLQLGKRKKQQAQNQKTTSENKSNKGKKKDYNKYTYNPEPNSKLDDLDVDKFANPLIQGKGRNQINGEIVQKISKESLIDASKEIPNKDYIDYVVSKMINPGKEKKVIRPFNDDKTHIPVNYEAPSQNISPEAVDYYFDAADALTGIILDGLGDKSRVFDNSDNCYASLLIDCSNTFSEIQKASLILISIAYGNALTALRIPYSIVIYCDDNFQFILKKLEDNHDKIFFAKLIEAMTVNRRMSSMTDAIQMAKLKIHPSPSGQFSNRTNHLIYVLSDGLSSILDITKQWNNLILNDKSVTVSFFFLNIIAGESTQAVMNVWSQFAKGIKGAESPTSVFYSTFEGILEHKDFYSVLSSTDPNANNNNNNNNSSITKSVSVSECFSQAIIQSISQEKKKYSEIIKLTKQPIKLISFDFNPDQVNSIVNLLMTPYSSETKYYIDTKEDFSLNELIDVETPEMKIEPFSINVNVGESSEARDTYSAFYKKLFDLSLSIIEQASIQELLSFVFVPNKPSQYTPSSDGTLFYFPGLIRFLLTQGQDTKIFLEKKAGLLKSYSVFIVVDCSISCINIQSSFHAFQSLFILLQALSKIDLPSFNLIVTTNDGPLILCSEKSTFDALSINSPIWVALFTYMLNPHPNSYLDSALLSTLAIRVQQKTLSSILFLFTDGNFSTKETSIYNSILENIRNYNVEAITIGIGSYSSNISSLETKKIWSVNPKNLIKAILAVFGKETNELAKNISSLYTGIQFDQKDIIPKLSSYLKFNSSDDYSFKNLIVELNSITRDISVFRDFYNIRPDGEETFTESDSHDIGKKNFYKGIKILICQFWDESMTKGESDRISKEILINGADESHRSVVNSLKEFGIEAVIVQNYKEAIQSIKSGEFSEVWVICGRHDGKMPDGSSFANLSSQFIDVLIIYWENGGGIVFWTDNAPLTAEVNFFLEKARFDDDKPVNFRIGGRYPGGKMLRRTESPKTASFVSEEMIQCDGYEKLLFNANMRKIFEGYTIASAIVTPEDAKTKCYDGPNTGYTFAYRKGIEPFRYFSISSSKGISSLYYTSPLESNKGDILIDCGFSKLFFELNTEGIYWYVRNIAIFMISIEKKMSKIGGTADPRKFRPKPFEYLIKTYAQPEPKFYPYNDRRVVDIVFLIDGTGSMEPYIEAVKGSCNEIAQYCKENFTDNFFKFGCIIYRDNAVKEVRNRYLQHNYRRFSPDETEFCGLNGNINELIKFLSGVEAKGGGGDGPEDWLSGYQKLKGIHWSKLSQKVVIHIAGAPAHGFTFNRGRFFYPHDNEGNEIREEYEEMDQEQDREFPKLIKWAADVGARFYCLSTSRSAFYSFERTQEIYYENKGKQFKIIKFHNYDGMAEITDDQRDQIIDVVKQVARESVDDAVAVDSGATEESHEERVAENRFSYVPPKSPAGKQKRKTTQQQQQQGRRRDNDDGHPRPNQIMDPSRRRMNLQNQQQRQQQQQQQQRQQPMTPPKNQQRPQQGKKKQEFVSAKKYFESSDDD